MAELGLTRAGGALVGAVQNDSAAAKAGIRAGDVIRAFNGKEIITSVGAAAAGGRHAAGQSRQREACCATASRSTWSWCLTTLDDGGCRQSGSPASKARAGADRGPESARHRGRATWTPTTRSKLGLEAGEGVRISRVASLAARQAGPAPGDVILQVGNDAGRQRRRSSRARCKGVKAGDRVTSAGAQRAQSTGLVTMPALR